MIWYLLGLIIGIYPVYKFSKTLCSEEFLKTMQEEDVKNLRETIHMLGRKKAINMSFCILILIWPFTFIVMLLIALGDMVNSDSK